MRRATLAIIAGLSIFCETASCREAQFVPAAAQLPSLPAPALAGAGRLLAIRGRGELLVCTAPDLPAISWRNARNGAMEGLDADMAHALAARLSVRPVFLDSPAGSAIAMLERGGCDLGMGGLGISGARAERVAFTKAYMAGPLAAVVPRASQRVAGWAELDRKGVVVAVIAGSVAEESMRQRLRQAELLPVRAPSVPEQEINAGRADVFVTDHADSWRLRGEGSWQVLDAPHSLADTLYAYAVPKGDPAWLAEVNGFLASARSDGTLFRAAQRWGLRPMLAE
ncbi:amino acid ABC transporter substrate-binding protein [Roseomonas sp. SSH11]|uniref:Amino acid ABC transporter substrate-binding protein n=1 Tax=Pararoseomonas baculiformis TaxID=2820812 RepID=A0ABS4AI10_9PROT|nr:ABC transporter substrate-binding protein [Pararoseomonas baculiformis]MBP0446667.1 amino acid ABC transporter substrate-binding protein [Pararoseomonas baculiformis]